MENSIMMFAVPVFILLILFEAFWSYRHKQERYGLNDTLNNFSTGIIEEVFALPLKAGIAFVYIVLYTHFALFKIDGSTWLTWLIAWIGVDFFYYWYHRASHRCTLLWAGHSVHHQSTFFNLSVALRQGIIQAMTSWVFYLPLAILGVSPLVFGLMLTINSIYQFWIHTQSIHKMGFLEHIFNTPSHHRVHHGTNSQYIDKNYAGSLIIWDKLFGTFEPEIEPVKYGVTEPLDSWNPLYANIKVIKDVLHYSKYISSPLKKMVAFIMPPEWILKDNEVRKNYQLGKQPKPLSPKGPYPIFMTGLCIFSLLLYMIIISIYPVKLSATISIMILMTVTLLFLGKLSEREH